MSLLFLLWFLLNKVQLSLWVSSRPTTSGHFVPVFGSTSSYDCISLWGQREGMLAVTAGLKYPHDMRVCSNETPDRCLHKLSAAHSLHLPERWRWLWAMTDVCVCVSLLARWWSEWQLVVYLTLCSVKGDSSLMSPFIRKLTRTDCVCMCERTVKRGG